MLALSDVHFAYGERPIVRGIDLAVARGELVSIVGQNGSGKTTLLRLCAGLLAPTRGEVSFLGAPPHAQKRHQLARQLSFLSQAYRLAFSFTVGEVVLMGRYAHGRRGLLALETDADVAAAREAMERCDVLALEDRRFDEISGGEQRRVLLAQAFCQDADLILLDEPTASLDPAHAIAVFEAIAARTATGRCGAIAVTHDLNLAARYSARIVVLADGAVLADGDPAAVLASDAAARAFGVAMHIGTIPDTDTRFVVPR